MTHLTDTDEGLRPCDCGGHTTPVLEVLGAMLMIFFLPLLLPWLWWESRKARDS